MNRTFLIAAPAALLLLSAVPVVAQQAQTSTAALAPAPVEDPNEIVCRSGTPMTGTRIPGSRVCHTRAEWDDIHKQAMQAVTQEQIDSKASGPIGH